MQLFKEGRTFYENEPKDCISDLPVGKTDLYKSLVNDHDRYCEKCVHVQEDDVWEIIRDCTL